MVAGASPAAFSDRNDRGNLAAASVARGPGVPKNVRRIALVTAALAVCLSIVSVDAAEQQRPRLNLTMQPIDYPIEALAAAEEGTVLVELGIGTDGAVTDVVLQQSSGHPHLDDAGILAARAMKLSSPPMRGGVPVAARLPAEIVWKLPLTLAEKYFALTDEVVRDIPAAQIRANGGIEPDKARIRPARPIAGGNRMSANEYPVVSGARGEMGRATFVSHIGVDGSVVNTYLASSTHWPRLDEAALKAVKRFRYQPLLVDDIPAPGVVVQRISFVLDGAKLSNCDENPVVTRLQARTREEAGESIPRYDRWTLFNAQGKVDESLLLTEKGWMSLDPALIAVMNEKADVATRGRPARCWVYDGVDPMMNG